MNAEGFARLAFEAYGHQYDTWPDLADDIERGKWLKVGELIDECVRGAGRDALRAGETAPAKVVIVTENLNGVVRERRYDAGQVDMSEYGHLRVLRKGREVGGYQPNGWLSWREDGAQLDDVTVKARRFQSALRQVAMAEVIDSPETELLQRIARAELERSGWDGDDL